MRPLKFDGVNVVYAANQPEYEPLPAEHCGGKCGQINTCWELSPDELKQVQETGKIWLSVLTFGQPLQPVYLATEKPPIFDPE